MCYCGASNRTNNSQLEKDIEREEQISAKHFPFNFIIGHSNMENKSAANSVSRQTTEQHKKN